MRKLSLLVILCLLLHSLTLAQESEKDLQTLAKRLFDADKTEQEKLVNSILALNPQAEHIENILKEGKEYSKDVKKGWQVLKVRCSDGKERPFHLYIPDSYEPTKRQSVIINLHGGVSRPVLLSEQQMAGMRRQFEPEAKDFIVILPQGQAGCVWWDEVGASNIISALRVAQKIYNIDENRIYLTGFSDGGSGSYYMALHHTTQFAAFAPLNGSIGVAQMGGPVYLPTLRNKPLYVVNGGRDPLYPAEEMRPIMEEMKRAGVDVTFKAYDNVGHDFSYGNIEKPLIIDFFNKNPRNPLPPKITIETSNINLARAHWVKIDKIEDIGNNEEFPDYNPMMTPKRVIIGVVLDPNFAGPGAKIQDIAKGSLAEKLGLNSGDIIIKLLGKEINSAQDIRSIMSNVKPDDELTITVKRGDNLLAFKEKIEKPKAEPAFVRNKGISGRIDVTASGNKIEAKVKNVSAYTLFISRAQFNVNEDIEVYTNGELSFKGIVKPDTSFMLTQFIEDVDRTMIFWGKIEIKVSGKER